MLNTRQRAAQPALHENTSTAPTARELVLAIDPTAKFFHYGPQGCKSGWVLGDGWETSITWNEKQAWVNALSQLEAGRAAKVDKTSTSEEKVELTPGGMYPKEVDAAGHTLHSRHCKAAFARRDWQCHRCCELMHGAAPRAGWARPFFAKKLREVQRVLLFPHSS